nr:MAG TPA: hypothetical protein [Caudoviricetes sp.]
MRRWYFHLWGLPPPPFRGNLCDIKIGRGLLVWQ